MGNAQPVSRRYHGPHSSSSYNASIKLSTPSSHFAQPASNSYDHRKHEVERRGSYQSQLELESIAQIKTLLPDLIRFTYVDKDTLGALDEISVPTQKKRNAKT
ncbi:hypothetical protein H4Q26_005799 [Puccinia striiformis f. sp. tritici PST-130]|nr:hypothetical protein H4Q26_005799 [Puccinia striiformis f. sp. tritici PST-130]